MKQKRFSEEQIIKLLQDTKKGEKSVEELCREAGCSTASFSSKTSLVLPLSVYQNGSCGRCAGRRGARTTLPDAAPDTCRGWANGRAATAEHRPDEGGAERRR
ncbi:hypothetical protein DAETH_37050 (plasmid) [Deinococcus aetherius]|uniref:Transposase n=1 Tax=Deinococcus aetherius TaxID=200252 RepID=A0ABM8AIW2_9DEIO|nr:hypothetical protein DAETH_37050 [Deinococcus aetherius]